MCPVFVKLFFHPLLFSGSPYFAIAQYGLSFLPVCAPTASASPRGHRERTLVRPLALGLASLYLHQTDKKHSYRPISLSLNTGFCRPISLSLNTGFWRPISLSLNTGSWLRLLPVGQYASAVALYRPLGSIRALSAMFVRKPLTGVYINKRRFNPRRCRVFRRRWGGATRSKPLTGAIISLAMMFQRKE